MKLPPEPWIAAAGIAALLSCFVVFVIVAILVCEHAV